MNTATKPLDRRKPFRRVDNKAFIPIRALDGDGAANGCRIDKDLGNIDEKLEAFLADTRDSVLGKTVGQVIDIVRLALNPNKLADLLLAVIKKEAGDVAFALAFPLVKALGAAAAVPLLPIRAIVEGIITPIETALRVFLISVARPIMIRANRLLPQWVPVEVGLSSNSVDRRQIIEIEGLCTRSFGNPVDAPLVNWHTWFSWNVEVQPEPEYAKALSPVSDPPNTSGMTGTERSIIKPGTFEIQWDAGALLSAGEQAIYNTKIADKDMQKVLAEIDKADLALALKAAPPELSTKLLSNLSARARDNIQEEISMLGPRPLSDVEEAQKRILQQVRTMEERGDIRINRGTGEVMV